MNLFGWLKSFLGKVMAAAKANGLTDDIVKLAMRLANQAAVEFETNEARRNFVLTALSARGVPDSLARFALESAVQMIKQRTAAQP